MAAVLNKAQLLAVGLQRKERNTNGDKGEQVLVLLKGTIRSGYEGHGDFAGHLWEKVHLLLAQPSW